MKDILDSNRVAIYQDENVKQYFTVPPFHPSQNYPEYVFGEECISPKRNETYNMVREALILLGLDKDNIDKKEWNPLKEWISSGDTVVLKPNFVLDKHYEGGTLDCVITQPDVIRAVMDYVYIALDGHGKIIVADAPQCNCDFDNLKRVTKVESIIDFYKKNTCVDVELRDLRQTQYNYNSMGYLQSDSRNALQGDKDGYCVVNLQESSEFYNVSNEDRIYGADYNRNETMKHHNGKTHEYCVSGTILNADVVICIPKMKVHRKAGVTLNLKNLIGINGNKNYLPHFKLGLKEDGGDEYMNLTKIQKKEQYIHRFFIERFRVNSNKWKDIICSVENVFHVAWRKVFYRRTPQNMICGGDWYGNDTIWRTVLDLNKILIYCDKNGEMCEQPQRRILCVVDGIIGGENEGPLVPTPKMAGVIAIGINPLLVDSVLARIMGFDIQKIPKLRHGFHMQKYPISNIKYEDIEIVSNKKEYIGANVNRSERYLAFVPSKGWIGNIEI